jgi:hypothetical protein
MGVAGEVLTVAPEIAPLMEQRLPSFDDGGILAGDVRVEGEPAGACDRELGAVELSPGIGDVEVLGVVQGDLEQLVTCRPGPADGTLKGLGGGVADPDEGVNADRVANRCDSHEAAPLQPSPCFSERSGSTPS